MSEITDLREQLEKQHRGDQERDDQRHKEELRILEGKRERMDPAATMSKGYADIEAAKQAAKGGDDE